MATDDGTDIEANEFVVEPDDDDEWVSPPTRVRNFSPWAQSMIELEAARPEEQVPTYAASVPGWRSRTRGRLTDLLGEFPESVTLDAELTDRVETGGFVSERLVFDSESTMSVPAYLLTPTARRRRGPAVLALHDHGSGGAEITDLDARGVAHPGAYARALVEAGYVVLVPDLRGFGERADPVPEGKDGCDANLVAAIAAGRQPLTGNLHDLVRGLDVLEEHPLVDPARFGVVGFSLGATLAVFLAAFDTRIRAAVVSGAFSSWHAAHHVPFNLCGSEVVFGMIGMMDHVDLGALVAPRALLVESGTSDPLVPIDAARTAVEQLESVYRAMRAPKAALHHHEFAGDHRWDGGVTIDFLEQWL